MPIHIRLLNNLFYGVGLVVAISAVLALLGVAINVLFALLLSIAFILVSIVAGWLRSMFMEKARIMSLLYLSGFNLAFIFLCGMFGLTIYLPVAIFALSFAVGMVAIAALTYRNPGSPLSRG